MISIAQLRNSDVLVRTTRFVVAQSILCHGDWTLDEHVSFVKYDEGIDTDQTVIVDGVHLTVGQLVQLWVESPDQCVAQAEEALV